MKTSHKILIITASLLLVLLTSMLLALRNDIKTILANNSMLEFHEVAVDKFDVLNFSSNWMVTIRQGKNHKVELAKEEAYNIHPIVQNKGGTLHFHVEETPETQGKGVVHARITAPVLQTIKAEGNTSVEMKTFWSDSLLVILEDSSTYVGKDLDYARISFTSSGDVR